MPGASLARAARLTVLIAEDDPDLRTLVADVLRRDGHEVVEAPDGATLLFNLARSQVSRDRWLETTLVLTDIRMPLIDGLSVLCGLTNNCEQHPDFVFMTGFGHPEA